MPCIFFRFPLWLEKRMEREQNAKDDEQSEFDEQCATGSFCPNGSLCFRIGLYQLLLYLFLCAVTVEEEWSTKAARSSDEPLFLVRRDRKRDLSGPKENWFVRAGKCARMAQETERKENEKAILDVQLSFGAGACIQRLCQHKR